MNACSHGFPVYGKSSYQYSTCSKCILSAYEARATRKKVPFIMNKDNTKDEKPNFDPLRKTKCPTPFTDTVSHFPSPGGEAEHGVFQPHLPLINTQEEIRPSEVPTLCEKFSRDNTSHGTRSPWESEEIVEDERVPVIAQSTAEQKMTDLKFGRALLEDKEYLRKLATQQFYKTSTQRFYEGAAWAKVLPKRRQSPELPAPRNDKSELEGQLRRYNKAREDHQKMTEMTSWDTVQSRDGFFVKRPVAFISESKKVNQIPNYMGTTGGFGEKDVENEKFSPLTTMRTQQPKYSTPGRKPYIPGYTGCVQNSQYREVFSKELLPRLEVTASTHSRFNTYPPNLSKFNHRALLSNNVTLTHPFNPYNTYSKNNSHQAERVY